MCTEDEAFGTKVTGETALPAEPRVPPATVSHMTAPELVNFGLQLRNRSEMEWQRVINIHAALIGAMIFFAGQADPYMTARLVVFAFYSFNLASSYLGMRDTFEGLRKVSQDLRLFGPPAAGGASFDWIASQKYSLPIYGRSALLIGVWSITGYLMITPLVLGHRNMWP
jgi:hypothetical protein